MQDKKKVILSWSGGKDSAFCLHELISSGTSEIVCLLTTLTEEYQRTCMHGVRRLLLDRQAESLGFPLEKVYLSADGDDKAYERKMRTFLEKSRGQGVNTVVFGDIFLEDLRTYREERLARAGMSALFPLWKRDTREMARDFIDSGFRAVITCVDSHFLDASFVGLEYDETFLDRLPETVDPCGENGEFHTFVYDGPCFQSRIEHLPGETVLRENRFYFCDLLPPGGGARS